MENDELLNLPIGDVWIFDTECYSNFWYAAFKHRATGKIIEFERSADGDFDADKLRWMLHRFVTVGFNSLAYDLPMINLALTGASCGRLNEASNELVQTDIRSWIFEKDRGLSELSLHQHIDLINVAPLQGSLKLYGARLHCTTIQELPIDPDTQLTWQQAQDIKLYCHNDLSVTELIYDELQGQLDLRQSMSERYQTDLMSKSDAQIAEKVLVSEIANKCGSKLERPKHRPNTSFKFVPHSKIQFRSTGLKDFLKQIEATEYRIDDEHKLVAPDEIQGTVLSIGKGRYRIGRGGLHSSEECVSHYADAEFEISDFDVESFYPRICLNHEMYPSHMPKGAFLGSYESIVNERIAAKRNKNNVVADSLKIVINGSFGKTGSRFSMLYDPEILIGITLSGQLWLLMLIEAFEMQDLSVISANTDGIVLRYPRARRQEVLDTISRFESYSNFKMEETRYRATHSRDVNNYIAIKTDGSTKGKGCFSNPWDSSKTAIFRFHKNPETTICIEAVIKFLLDGTPVKETVSFCDDIRKFVAVKNVKGGAVKNGKVIPIGDVAQEQFLFDHNWICGANEKGLERWKRNEFAKEMTRGAAYKQCVKENMRYEESTYLGKVVRWYYAIGEEGCLTYKLSGNKVPKSDGAKPLMTLPKELPNDLNYHAYFEICEDMLHEIGYWNE